MVTVHLVDGWTGEKLLDVIRGLYIYYPPGAAPSARRPARRECSCRRERTTGIESLVSPGKRAPGNDRQRRRSKRERR